MTDQGKKIMFGVTGQISHPGSSFRELFNSDLDKNEILLYKF